MNDTAIIYDMPSIVRIKNGMETNKLVFSPISWAQEELKLKIKQLFMEGQEKLQQKALASRNALNQEELKKIDKKATALSEDEVLETLISSSLEFTDYVSIVNILFLHGYIKIRLETTAPTPIDMTLSEADLILFMDRIESSERLKFVARWVKIFLL